MTVNFISPDEPSRVLDTAAAALGHFAFCAQVALHLTEQDNGPLSPMGQHLFLLRWLVMAQKQKRFPKAVAPEIAELIAQGRQLGGKADLVKHLQSLYRACCSPLAEQSDLFRLTYVIESLKMAGWSNHVLSDDEWSASSLSDSVGTGFTVLLLEENLHASFDEDGTQIMPVEIRLQGPMVGVVTLLSEQRYYSYTEVGDTGWQHLLVSTTPIADDFCGRIT